MSIGWHPKSATFLTQTRSFLKNAGSDIGNHILQLLVKPPLYAETPRWIGLVATRQAKRTLDEVTFPSSHGLVERSF
jgi:hypothetical protein